MIVRLVKWGALVADLSLSAVYAARTFVHGQSLIRFSTLNNPTHLSYGLNEHYIMMNGQNI